MPQMKVTVDSRTTSKETPDGFYPNEGTVAVPDDFAEQLVAYFDGLAYPPGVVPYINLHVGDDIHRAWFHTKKEAFAVFNILTMAIKYGESQVSP